MPVILRQQDYGRWLSRDDAQRPPVDLLRPFDPLLMEMAPAHPKVGNVRNQGPDMLLLNSS
jgi:putative SOS response-associated peptidase YedK